MDKSFEIQHKLIFFSHFELKKIKNYFSLKMKKKKSINEKFNFKAATNVVFVFVSVYIRYKFY